MDTTVLVLVIVVVALLIAAVTLGLMLSRRKRSERLQEQFGPEYERSVSTTGDRKPRRPTSRNASRGAAS